eukprot:TRINITY_DN48390_c0_g1_i1.p1 TRINITY_DN48390_c0_g1~~TRINITY_DN48390_c0_g1_i1.p1  ORF type:complete len:393 (+),score=54.81 TRINITY_DN48390_c0_g1_i1:221-1399(+)
MTEKVSLVEILRTETTGRLLQRSARQQCSLEFVATFSPLSVRREQLLVTRLGQWLEDKGLLVPSMALIMAVYSAGEVGSRLGAPLLESRTVTVHTDGVQYKLQVVSLAYSMAKVLLLVLGCMLACHRMNRQVFMWCWQSFDAYMLLSAHMICFVARMYNVETVFCDSGACDPQIQLQLVTDGFSALVSGIFTGAMDCLAIDRYKKIALCSLVLSIYVGYYARSRWIDDQYWTKSPVCWWICASPQTVYVSGFAQSLVFLCKTWIAYVRGLPLAILRPEYVLSGHKATLEEVLLNKCTECWRYLLGKRGCQKHLVAGISCQAEGFSSCQVSTMEAGMKLEKPDTSPGVEEAMRLKLPAMVDLRSQTPDTEVARLQAYVAELEAKLWSKGKAVL